MILIIAAMASEVKAIIDEFSFKSVSESDHLYELKNNQQHIYLAISQVGKVNAAFHLSKLLSLYTFDAIYNIGFAGATQPFKQSEVVYITEATYHDFDLSMFGYAKGQVPNCPARFKSDDQLMKEAQLRFPRKEALLYTGDYFMTQQNEGEYIVDMEGAAFYHVAFLTKTPILSIKVVSDVMGMDNHLNAYQAFESTQGAQILLEVFKKVIKED
jgi:adenosylhomocysteine nucleosidase